MSFLGGEGALLFYSLSTLYLFGLSPVNE